MVKIIAKREFLKNLLNLRFPISIFLCVILILMVAYIRSSDYEQELKNYQMSIKLQEERVKEYASLSWVKYEVYKPPSKFMIFFRGCPWKGEYTGTAFGLTPKENPFNFLFSIVDLGWVIGAIMGLLAIIFAYDAFTSEKENGTLRLVFSNPVPRHTAIIGKWIGGYIPLISVFLVSFLLSIIVMALNPSIQIDQGDWIALGMVTLTSFLVISAFFWLAILISIKAKTSFTSLLISLAIWALFVLLIPNLSPGLANILSKTPSIEVLGKRKDTIKGKYRNLREEELQKYRDKGDIKGALLAVLKKDSPFRKGQLKMMEEIRKVETDFNNKAKKEVNTSISLSSLSPFASFVYAVNTLSGTGVRSQEFFSESAKEFQAKAQKWYFRQLDKVAKRAEKMTPSDIKEANPLEERLDVTNMPRYHYKEDIGGRVASSLVYILILVLYNVLFFMAAYLSFLRCPID